MTGVSLTPEEARVLGCLMEKAVTTPDNYPLSVNALINACNQSTNRYPIVTFDEATVEHALEGLRDKGVSRRVRATGQRVIKHRHIAEEALGLDRPEATLLGVLLLRGAQTPGELKQRTERWHSFRSLDDVEEPVDIVVVFRRPELTPPIAAQAVRIGAKALWLQTGVVNEEAARIAAGLVVVMDDCIGVAHSRLRIPPKS